MVGGELSRGGIVPGGNWSGRNCQGGNCPGGNGGGELSGHPVPHMGLFVDVFQTGNDVIKWNRFWSGCLTLTKSYREWSGNGHGLWDRELDLWPVLGTGVENRLLRRVLLIYYIF